MYNARELIPYVGFVQIRSVQRGQRRDVVLSVLDVLEVVVDVVIVVVGARRS